MLEEVTSILDLMQLIDEDEDEYLTPPIARVSRAAAMGTRG